MRYHNIEKDSMLNGTGIRVVLWLAGCEHHCHACQNPITWDPTGGLEFTTKEIAEIMCELNKEWVDGITFSGGDPLYKGHRGEVELLCHYFKSEYPNKTIWMYTGYSWDEVKHLPNMKYVDVLVDGKFIEELKEVSYPWAGSTNQRVIDVQKSLEIGKTVLWSDGYESSKYNASECGE